MASFDDTAAEAILKTLYPQEEIKNLVYMRNPAFALIPKMEKFEGDSSKEPVIIATPQNRSGAFGVANNINTTSIVRAFLVTRVSNYSMASIANETMLASESNQGAFMEALKLEMDNALLSLTRAIAVQMYRGGTGVVARIAAGAVLNSATIPVQLSNIPDITNLEYGMAIGFSPTAGGAAETGTAYIVVINRTGPLAGTFLCSATPGGAPTALSTLVPTVADLDYIYQSVGDVDVTISGFQAWLPGSAVSATPFFSVNRAVDSTRLAGVTYDGSSQAIEEALIDGANIVAREGGNPDHCFMNYKDYANLIKSIGSKQQFVQYTDVKVNEPGVTVGFNALILTGPNGPMKVIADQNCPAGYAFLLQLDTWKLKSLGNVVRLFDGDGLTMIRDPNADALLIRCVSYANLSCRAPGYNAVVTLPQ